MHALRFGFAMGLAGMLLAIPGLRAQQNGALSGTVVEESGGAVEGALVSATRSYSKGAAPFSASAVTGKDGRFELASLPDGAYRVCVQKPGSELLDPCHWSEQAPDAVVKAGQPAGDLKIALKRGARVRVRINDTGAALKAYENKRNNAGIMVGVWSPKGVFHAAAVGASDDKGREYTAVIPYDLAVTMTAQSWFFKVEKDEAEQGPMEAISGGVRLKLQHADRKAEKKVVLKVAGIQAPLKPEISAEDK